MSKIPKHQKITRYIREDADTEVKQMLKLSNKDFKEGIIKILQQAIMNSLKRKF